MNTPALFSSWKPLGKPQILAGYTHGLLYPSLLLGFTGPPLPVARRQALEAKVATFDLEVPLAPADTDATTGNDATEWAGTARWLLDLLCRLQRACGLPVYDNHQLLSLGEAQAVAVLPCYRNSAQALSQVFGALLAWLGSEPADSDAQQAREGTLRRALAQLKDTGPTASNVPRFARAAHRLRIPVRELPGQILQYGLGSRQCWLDSTFTGQTGALAARLARNKVWSQALLRRAGVPVPEHYAVANADTAVQIAQRLGYPVVVKPADQDGGVAVAAGLVSDDEVRASFEAAREHSSNILVEKHVQGRDYRLTVFRNELLWAVEREPGGITGDGVRTVEQLLSDLNADPRRSRGSHTVLEPLDFDDEARLLLSRARLTPQSIPAKGEFIRLRRTANVATGGVPIAAFERVHPDNAQLAVRAAQTLGLDFAGIDMLIPDIAVSWQSSGAYLCEINGQPGFGPGQGVLTASDLYEPLLRRMVQGDGRIPIILVLGASRPSIWTQALRSTLAAAGLRVGVADEHGVRLDSTRLRQPPVSAYAAGDMLGLHREVDAMVIAIQDTTLLQTGLPVERYDALVLAGPLITMPEGDDAPGRTLTALLKLLLAACDGEVFHSPDSGLKIDPKTLTTSATWSALPGGIRNAATVARRAMELRKPSDGTAQPVSL